MKIFCYGTLKQGHGNHRFLRGQKFLGKHFTRRGYTIVVGGLPYMIKRKSGSGVMGELYEVDAACLARLDELEGHPDYYRRTVIPVYSQDTDDMVEASAYLYPDVFKDDAPTKREY